MYLGLLFGSMSLVAMNNKEKNHNKYIGIYAQSEPCIGAKTIFFHPKDTKHLFTVKIEHANKIFLSTDIIKFAKNNNIPLVYWTRQTNNNHNTENYIPSYIKIKETSFSKKDCEQINIKELKQSHYGQSVLDDYKQKNIDFFNAMDNKIKKLEETNK